MTEPDTPATEAVSARYNGLDTWESTDVLHAMWEGQAAAVAALRPVLPALARAGDAMAARLAASRHGRFVYAGAGTSARLGVQDGVELVPTFHWPPERLAYLVAGGAPALTRAIEGAEDDGDAAARAVADARIGADDVLVGLAASGSTRFTVQALTAGAAAGALTVAIANAPEAPLLAAAHHPILIETGAEVIAGSTRMKAGTAQRAALTLLSSLVMVRLNRVHDNLMVDVEATNAKLVARAERLVRRLTGCDLTAARTALEACQGRVKAAVLVIDGADPEGAEQLLADTGGSLRRARTALGEI
ncbi:MAG: N-acetylmuramic acid 6-phosphate etherase [Rhodospirillaceae bacterium]|nr:N-acetylmuramic acid 6-phosphate etherase [Rhodospirillaceae bacterium]